MTVELRPHQVKALHNLSNGKILYGGVGTGKSMVSLAYYCKNEMPKKLYIITTAKKRDDLDWVREALRFGVLDALRSTLVDVMVVDSWNQVSKYEDVENAFFIFDEQRLVGSGTWVKSFLKISQKNTWILLSATPGDSWLDYIPVFVANGFYKNRTEFKRLHVIYNTYTKFPKVDRYVAVGTLVRLRNHILVEMPYEKTTKRHVEYIPVKYDKVLYEEVTKKRWHIYENRPIRNIAELIQLARRVVNSDRSRIEAVKTLMKSHPRLIVFYNFDYELKILRELGELTNVGEWNGHKHDEIPAGKNWIYLVQYTAGSEGWECIETDSIAFYSLTYSYRAYEQSKGRTDRLNTPFINLNYFVLLSDSWIDQAIMRCLKGKKNFNENAFSKSL